MITITDFPKEMRPFEPRGNALTLLKSRRTELLLAGPAGTGKSNACLQKLHICARKYPHCRLLIVRKTRASITQTAMVTYEQKVLPEGWLGNVVHFRTQEQQYEYPNGSIIAVGGIDKPSKIMSSEWDVIYVMEATELSEDDLESLTTRLRNNVLPYQQIIMDCNPGAPTHWLKRRCDRGVTLLLESRHEDNPSVTQAYLATLDALTGVRHLRLRLGKWAAAEGVVYDQWERNIHVVSKQQLIEWSIFYEDGHLNRAKVKHVIGGADWGYTNPGVLHIYAVDTDLRLYLIREVYRTHKTIDWWLTQGERLTQEFGVEQWIGDPSEPAYIAQFNARGLNMRGAMNDIAPGISYLQKRLQVAGDGKPRFFVWEYALKERDEELDQAHKPYCLEQEIDSYVWQQAKDGKPIKEEPVDDANHALDVARYCCAFYDSGNTEIEIDRETAEALSEWRGW